MLLYGRDKEIAAWVSKRIGGFDFGLCTAIGVVQDNELIAGIVYSNFIRSPYGEPISIEISMNSVDKRWCSRDNLNQLLAYPFIQLGVKRVQCTCAKKDKNTRTFLERLGFRLEGVGRKAWPLGGDSTLYSILRNECRWIYGRSSSKRADSGTETDNGRQRSRKSSASSSVRTTAAAGA